ncbi:hypothetical protein PGB90_004128 [Kerria lacca]
MYFSFAFNSFDMENRYKDLQILLTPSRGVKLLSLPGPHSFSKNPPHGASGVQCYCLLHYTQFFIIIIIIIIIISGQQMYFENFYYLVRVCS